MKSSIYLLEDTSIAVFPDVCIDEAVSTESLTSSFSIGNVLQQDSSIPTPKMSPFYAYSVPNAKDYKVIHARLADGGQNVLCRYSFLDSAGATESSTSSSSINNNFQDPITIPKVSTFHSNCSPGFVSFADGSQNVFCQDSFAKTAEPSEFLAISPSRASVKIVNQVSGVSALHAFSMPLGLEKLADKSREICSPDFFDTCEDGEMESQDQSTKIKRISKKCPKCNKEYVNISRHLRDIHKICPQNMKDICFAMRRRKRVYSTGLRKCPLQGCEFSFPYARLSSHLKFKHHLSVFDKIYQEICPSKPKSKILNDDNMESKKCVQYSLFSEEQSKKYLKYLSSLNGGRKSEINANQHRYKIRQILSGAGINSVEDFRATKINDQLMNWTEIFAKTHDATSVITYLSVLISYLKYIHKDIDRKNEEIKHLLENVKNWKKCYRSEVVKKDEYDELSPEQLYMFENSDVVKNSVSLLSSMKYKDAELQLESHTRLRNVILMLILLRNSHRSGALYNMLLSEFEKSIQVEGHYIVKVVNHKTKGEHGPADVVLTEDLHSFIDIYILKMRKAILQRCNKTCDYVFVTWSGKKMTSSDLNKNLTSLWRSVGFSTPFGSSRIRHTITTIVHSKDKENVQNLANHLCHRTTTAERFYKKKNNDSQSISISATIHNHLIKKETADIHQDESADLNPKENIHTDVAPSTQQVNSVEATFEFNDGRGRRTFTDSERKIIFNAYKEYINTCIEARDKHTPKLDKIRKLMQSNKELNKLVTEKKFKDVQIKGCLISIIKKQRAVQ